MSHVLLLTCNCSVTTEAASPAPYQRWFKSGRETPEFLNGSVVLCPCDQVRLESSGKYDSNHVRTELNDRVF